MTCENNIPTDKLMNIDNPLPTSEGAYIDQGAGTLEMEMEMDIPGLGKDIDIDIDIDMRDEESNLRVHYV